MSHLPAHHANGALIGPIVDATFSAPFFAVLKPGSLTAYRKVADFTALREHIVHPQPSAFDFQCMLSYAHGRSFFFSLGLTDAFHQITLGPAFRTIVRMNALGSMVSSTTQCP